MQSKSSTRLRIQLTNIKDTFNYTRLQNYVILSLPSYFIIWQLTIWYFCSFFLVCAGYLCRRWHTRNKERKSRVPNGGKDSRIMKRKKTLEAQRRSLWGVFLTSISTCLCSVETLLSKKKQKKGRGGGKGIFFGLSDHDRFRPRCTMAALPLLLFVFSKRDLAWKGYFSSRLSLSRVNGLWGQCLNMRGLFFFFFLNTAESRISLDYVASVKVTLTVSPAFMSIGVHPHLSSLYQKDT